MGGLAVGRYGGPCLRTGLLAAMWLTALPPYRLTAQIGHDPARSPFSDIPRGNALQLMAGRLTGERGRAGVGLTDVTTFTARYDLAVGGPIRFVMGLGYGRGNRFVVDPAQDELTRRSGPEDADLYFADIELQFLLTGRKTWHALAPYLGGALGLAIGGDEPDDPASYAFGTKITAAPAAGVRWYVARGLSLQADIRYVYWRLRYPAAYQVPPGPDEPAVLPSGRQQLTEWTGHPWVSLGIGWTF